MRKHRQKQNVPNSRIADANHELGHAAQSSVFGVVDSIDGGKDFAVSYLRQEYLTKYCDETLVPGSERRANAIRKFLECEQVNAQTNERFRTRDPGFNILPRVSWSSFLRFARTLTRDILGALSDDIVLGGFTGGASTSRPRTSSHPAQKFVGKADLTSEVWYTLDILYREAPFLRQDALSFTNLNEVEGAVLFTVPKKTDIDRCACKEPDINMFLQKGVGKHIRRRLLRFGINLNDQSINRSLARQGSKDNTLATLDLSSASDTVSIELVRALLPADWFLYLNDIRSQKLVIDEEIHRTEMFSSMGNGFTFELESMLFFVLMRTTAYFEGIKGIISVYGDDIIIPSRMYDLAAFVLKEFGFSLNAKKSYADGPFRESCGGHFYDGIDVTPFYLKRRATRLTDVIRVANQLRRWAMADLWRRYEIPGLYQVWSDLAELVPKALWGGSDYSVDTRLVGPRLGDKALRRVSQPMRLPDLGSYAFWQSSNWGRSHSAEPSEKPVSTNQMCRLKRANPGDPVNTDWFYEELVG